MTKNNIIKAIIFLISIFLLLIFTSNIVFAEAILDDPTKFNPTKDDISLGSDVETIIKTISGFLMALGIVVCAICVALIGFTSILGSANEKADAQGKYIGIIIGAILVTSVSAIAKFAISIAEKI